MSDIVYVEKLKVQADGKYAWVPEAVEVNTEADFSIDELNLNREICRMGQLLLKYGDLAAELQVELARKEEDLKFISANLSAAYRSTAEANGTKLTVDGLKDMVTLDARYQSALAPLHLLRVSAVKADHWWRSMNTKAKMLDAMAFRQSAELRRGYN